MTTARTDLLQTQIAHLEAELTACREQARIDVKMLMTELADARGSASDALDLAHSLVERLEGKDAEIEDIQSALIPQNQMLRETLAQIAAAEGQPLWVVRDIATTALVATGGQG